MRKTQEKLSKPQAAKIEKKPSLPVTIKPDPSPKITEEKKSVPTRNDDSSDEDSQNIKKLKKNSVPTPDFNTTFTKINIEQSKNYSMNLLKERGFDLEEQDMKIFSNEMGGKNIKKNEATQIFAGQNEANLKTLELELKKALEKNNRFLACSIMNTILSRDLDKEKAKAYRLQLIGVLSELKSFKDSVIHCKKLLETGDIDINTKKTTYFLSAKAKLEINEIWDGYFDLLKAKSLSLISRSQNHDQASNIEKFNNELEETLMIFEMKLAKSEKSSLDILYLTGSNKSGVLGVKSQGIDSIFTFTELRNRMICSIACEDHYSLLIAKLCTCIQNNFDFMNCLAGNQECNGETVIVGWGENTLGQIDPNLAISFVERPFILNEFIGKNIRKVASWKSVSIAADDKGNVYEWGSNIEGVQIGFKMEKKIKDLIKGPSYTLILTTDSALFAYGRFSIEDKVIFDYAKPTEIAKNLRFSHISIGSNHILAINDKNELYGLGSNVFGQLCFGESEKETLEFIKIEKCKHLPMKKTFCSNNISFVLTEEGEIYYFGQISMNKIVRYPAQTEFPEEMKIREINGNNEEVFAINENGHVFCWNLGTSAVFKLYSNTKNETFKEIYIGKHYQLLLKTLPVPSNCSLTEEKGSFYETFKKISLKVEIKDHTDFCSIIPFYCLRFFICLSNSSIEDTKNMRNLCKDLVNNHRIKYNNISQVFYEEILYHRLKNLKITMNPSLLHQYNLDFFVEKSGTYFIYLFINETLINNSPFEISIAKSPCEEENLMKKQENIEKEEKKALESLEKHKEIETQRQEEQDLIEKKQKETEKRAEEALKKHLQEKNEALIKEEMNKKMKADLITGGGYDLEKSKKGKSEKIPEKKPVGMKNVGNSSQTSNKNRK